MAGRTGNVRHDQAVRPGGRVEDPDAEPVAERQQPPLLHVVCGKCIFAVDLLAAPLTPATHGGGHERKLVDVTQTEPLLQRVRILNQYLSHDGAGARGCERRPGMAAERRSPQRAPLHIAAAGRASGQVGERARHVSADLRIRTDALRPEDRGKRGHRSAPMQRD